MSDRHENPRTIGLALRGWELVRHIEMEEEMRAQGTLFRSKAGGGQKSRVSGPGYRQPRVHKHHHERRPAVGRD